MKIDIYSKAVLTGILILPGLIAFDYKSTMTAEAGIMSGGEMIVGNQGMITQLKGG